MILSCRYSTWICGKACVGPYIKPRTDLSRHVVTETLKHTYTQHTFRDGNVERMLLQLSEPVKNARDVHVSIAYYNISSVWMKAATSTHQSCRSWFWILSE